MRGQNHIKFDVNVLSEFKRLRSVPWFFLFGFHTKWGIPRNSLATLSY